MKGDPKRIAVELPRERLERLATLVRDAEKVSGQVVADDKSEESLAETAVNIACNRLSEYLEVQEAVHQVTQEKAVKSEGEHTLYPIVVPNNTMDECTRMMSTYIEQNPRCPQAKQYSDGITPEAVVNEAMQVLMTVLSGRYAEMVRETLQEEAAADTREPHPGGGYRYVAPDPSVIN